MDRHAVDTRDTTGRGRTETETTAYARSPRDVLRLLVFAVATLAFLGLTRWGERAILGFEQDLVSTVSVLSPAAGRVLVGLLTLAVAIAALGVWVVPVVSRRYRLFGYLVISNVVTAALFGATAWWLDRDRSVVLENELGRRAGIDASEIVSVASLAQLAGAFLVLAPFVGHRWRRAGAISLATMVVARIVVSVTLPSEVFVGLLIGATVGSAVLALFGRPSRRPTEDAIVTALADSALPTTALRPATATTPAAGGDHYVADLADGGQVLVDVHGQDERAADLLYRLYRFARLKDAGDARPFANLRRAVEHEALVALYARDVGVRTPRPRSVVDVGADSMLLAFEALDARPVAELADAEVTDDLIRATWEQVALLRRHRIAHRDLRRASVAVDDDGRPWLTDLGFAELAASDALLATDLAHLLVSFAIPAGADRSVACAVEVLGPEAVGAALPRLHPMALSSTTRAALKQRKGLLGEVQQAVVDRCGVEEIRYEQLSRVSRKQVFTLAMLAAVTYFLLPQFADLPEIVDRVKGADWWWLPPLLAASFLSYVGATIAMMGSVPDPLPLGPTLLTQGATSFTGTLAPAGIGGMAVNVRFLQKQGVDQPVAVSGVGLNTAAGVVGHVVLLLVFAVWAGRRAFDSFRLPDPRIFVIVGLALLGVGAVSLAVPASRRLIVARLVPPARQALAGVTDVLVHPAKVLALLGGSIFVTLSYLFAVYFAVEAFGGGLSFAAVGAAYLLGSAVATAAPTPGGLGAMEAAIIATLVAAGLDNAVAVPAVFLYRFATFWIPIAPGWASYTYLRRADYL